MGYAGIVNNELRLGNRDFSTVCSGKSLFNGGLNVDYKSELLSRDKVRVSLKFRCNTADTFARMIELASSTGYRNYSDNSWNGLYENKKYIISDPDSAALYILNDGADYNGFYYGDGSSNTLSKLDVEYRANETYYLVFETDNTNQTFDMYLQTSPVDEQSKLAVSGVGMFNKSETPIAPTTVQMFVYN